jgi:two-component system, cell cycle response regulator
MAVRKILLIDDDRLQRRLTEQYLADFRTERFFLECATSYEEGLQRLMQGDYAACLLDYQLGLRDGLALLEEAKRLRCETPVIFLTAESSDRVDIQAMEAGALDYLVKGEITPHGLERSIRYALKLSATLSELRRQATHDELTGLLNRRELGRTLAEEIERSERFGRACAVVMFDVDHFKAINDTHGHLAGDDVLRVVAQRLSSAVRAVDRVARYGGDELAVVLVEVDADAALEVANRLVDCVRRVPIELESGCSVHVTVSAGVATSTHHGETPAGLIAAADRALYQAKRAGRDRAALATAPLALCA